jgi:hypothetical protein
MTFLASPRPEPPAIENPARLRALSCERITSLFRSGLSFGPDLGPDDVIGPDPVTTARAVEVRCPIRDCPGHGGWVIEQLIGDPMIVQYPILLYVAPRGYKLGKSGAFVPTERMKEQRQRGFRETAGRRPNRAGGDSLAAPLLRSEMPAEAWAFGSDGWLVRCPCCRAPRFLRVTEEGASAHLPKERCGMVGSA